MMLPHLRIPILILASFCFVLISESASAPSRGLLGIAPQDENYYKLSVIKCKDGSKKFTKEQLNDEFCDCPDGTDEPGTSACPEGKFYCPNVGHVPLTIFSSRVNDGICDCCDGSDEYSGKVSCVNRCWEAGKVAREKLKKKITVFQDGVVIRKQEVEKAKHAFSKDEDELSKLKNDEKMLKDLVQKLKEHKERIEKAEEEVRLKKEEEKRLKEDEGKASSQETPSDDSPPDNIERAHDKPNQDAGEDDHDAAVEDDHDAAVEALMDHNDETEHVGDDHDSSNVGNGDDARSGGASPNHVGPEHLEEDEDAIVPEYNTGDDTRSEVASHNHAVEQEQGSDDTGGLSREELGRLVASRWTGEISEQKSNEIDNTVKTEEHDSNEDVPDNSQEDDNYGYTSENDEETSKYDDEQFEDGSDDEFEDDPVDNNDSFNPDEDDKEDISDFTASNSPSWLDKLQQTVQNVMQAFNFLRTPVDISEASRIRKEYDDSSSKLSKIQSRISSLIEKLKFDFGKEKEFYSYYGQCFEYKENKYVYKVCPFKKASQVEGHSTTQLGQWDKFEESYRVMHFSNGDRCWNGPDRSLKVRLRCGLTNELTDVDEPSRCEYVAMLSTPALCLEEKLKELQDKLERMNTSQPLSHDEL